MELILKEEITYLKSQSRKVYLENQVGEFSPKILAVCGQVISEP